MATEPQKRKPPVPIATALCDEGSCNDNSPTAVP
ncbi:hypothetical protein FOPG_18623 [Fusarium oxysporum f. sp. conglutinans race 2 54008]|uniref:Uncharacterized protein n=1 Tax=Fusarium oxysporum f. sp. conglutinans race 2 54008 TaxID=1089457 RepID=X0HVD9_FUSOX|nr:hypothetical protein FOPG_18623 [Fusarium oxysporum f. sp. conglutinans race 2 54008]